MVKSWPSEHVERLRALWGSPSTGDLMSASKIANALNAQFGSEYTRNSVIGRVHRLGLPMRAPRRSGYSERPGIVAMADNERKAKSRQRRVEAMKREREAVEAAHRAAIAEALERQREEEAKAAETVRIAAVVVQPAPKVRVSVPARAFPKTPKERPQVVAPEPIAAVAPVSPAIEIPKVLEVSKDRDVGGVSIFELCNPNKELGIPGTCRFPLGNRMAPATRYCGKPPVPGRPYCKECCEIAYHTHKKTRATAQVIPISPPVARVFAAT